MFTLQVVGFANIQRLKNNLPMLAHIFFKYLAVVGGAMVKFILGPTTGFLQGLAVWETFGCTVVGMMLSVSIVLGLGTPMRNFLIETFGKDQKRFTPRKRMIVRVWKKYGLAGIAFLTPLILTPIGGSLITVSIGEKTKRILLFMLLSACLWGFVLTLTVYWAGDWLKTYIKF